MLTSSLKLASIVLDIPTTALDAPYTYVVGDGVDAEVGSAVLVPFGGRKAIGFVMAVSEADPDDLPDGVRLDKLKGIERVLSRPYFDEEGAACAEFIAHRYLAPLCSCVRLFAPPGGVPSIVKGREGWRIEDPKIGEVDDRWVVATPLCATYQARRSAVKQQAILEALRQGELRVAELKAELGAVDSSLKSLESKGVVRIERRRRIRTAPDASPCFGSCGVRALTAGQARAVAAIDRARAAASGEVVLVDGVTGSGKTEVYLQAIAHTLEEGRCACVLVPEISLTPQTVARFRGRFGDTVAVLHSRMSLGERFDQWDFIRSGGARVVVGARSALFSPLRNVGLFVIDEEHETTYKQDSAPRYHAREVACWMAARTGAAVVLGSATPSIESLYACHHDESWHHVELPERANGRPLPRIDIVDMAREFQSGHKSMFSRMLIDSLHEELSLGRKAVLMLNQRGFAKFLLCRDCGFVPECPSCSTSLTYHERGGALVCHHCGYRVTAPALCPACGSPYLRKFGAGTQRVEDELVALIAGFSDKASAARVIRMDADTTSGKGAHQRLLEEFASSDAAVLLGTQMIAKGLDFDDVTLVGVINADTTLKLPDYRAGERTFDLIEQVAGRAGRAELSGRVIVQTYEADSAPIRAAAAYDRALFLRDELPKRKLLGYPPYVRMANVLVWGRDESLVRAAAEGIYRELATFVRDTVGNAWTILPATPCVLAKLRNTYRWHIVVKSPLGDDLPGLIEPLFRSRKPRKEVNVAIDVDPCDLL